MAVSFCNKLSAFRTPTKMQYLKQYKKSSAILQHRQINRCVKILRKMFFQEKLHIQKYSHCVSSVRSSMVMAIMNIPNDENRSFLILLGRIFRFGLRSNWQLLNSLWIYLFQYETQTIMMILSTGNKLWNNSALVYTRCGSRN